MGDFRPREGNRFGGSRGGGFGGRGGGRDRGPVTMHQAICSECGKPCEVPFQPTSGKPVYCSECFGTRRDSEGGSGGRFPQKSFDRHESPSRTSFSGNADRGSSDEVKKQLELLNTKMDQLIKIVGTMMVTHPSPIKEKAIELPVKKATIVKAKKVVKALPKKAKK
jgi:CxxC-x17-CxxC domain-containing protein